jgi:hypothetical protein
MDDLTYVSLSSGGWSVFSIAVDRTHTVLLVSFTDRMQVQDVADLDRLVRPLAATEALEKVVVDLREVTEIDMPLEQLVERASAKPVLPGRKLIFVAAAGLGLNVSRQYAAYREHEGHDAIPIVPDLEEAWRLLGIDPPTFGYRA